MATTISEKKWVRITPEEQAGFTIQSKDGCTYALSLAEAKSAGRSVAWFREVGAQVTDLMDALMKWLFIKQEKLDRAHFSFAFNTSVATFAVIQKTTGYDSGFQDELGDLDLQIHQNAAYNRLKFRSLALPPCSDDVVASLMDLSNAWIVNFGSSSREENAVSDVER